MIKKPYNIVIYFLFTSAITFVSCHNPNDEERIAELESEVAALQEELESKSNELDEAEEKIEQLKTKLDNIQSYASDANEYLRNGYFDNAVSSIDDIEDESSFDE